LNTNSGTANFSAATGVVNNGTMTSSTVPTTPPTTPVTEAEPEVIDTVTKTTIQTVQQSAATTPTNGILPASENTESENNLPNVVSNMTSSVVGNAPLQLMSVMPAGYSLGGGEDEFAAPEPLANAGSNNINNDTSKKEDQSNDNNQFVEKDKPLTRKEIKQKAVASVCKS
jgi:hypothetical protein